MSRVLIARRKCPAANLRAEPGLLRSESLFSAGPALPPVPWRCLAGHCALALQSPHPDCPYPTLQTSVPCPPPRHSAFLCASRHQQRAPSASLSSGKRVLAGVMDSSPGDSPRQPPPPGAVRWAMFTQAASGMGPDIPAIPACSAVPPHYCSLSPSTLSPGALLPCYWPLLLFCGRRLKAGDCFPTFRGNRSLPGGQCRRELSVSVQR